MSERLFFIKNTEHGLTQHRWLLFKADGTFEFSEFFANKASMVKDCVNTFKLQLVGTGFIFEDMSPGMVSFIQKAVTNRYKRGVNYFDECSDDSHEPGCSCQGKRDLEETEEL